MSYSHRFFYFDMDGTNSKVLAGGRVSLPESFKRKWALAEGDIVILQEDARGLRITTAQVTERPVPQ